MPKMYGWVREVVPESPADKAGLQPGDLIRTINGNTVRDLVDYRFYVADEELMIGFDRQQEQHEVRIAKTSDENLGVLFGEEPAPFIRQCANKCVFCFIKGLPERFAPVPGLEHGMRSSLYIKDDDYRYSFLFGNFITLTNLKEHDWQRLPDAGDGPGPEGEGVRRARGHRDGAVPADRNDLRAGRGPLRLQRRVRPAPRRTRTGRQDPAR